MLSLILGSCSFPAEAVIPDDFQLGNRGVVLISDALASSNDSVSYQKNRYGDIMEAMGKAYDHLLASQKDLDEDAARVLYEDLWSLYE